MIVYLQGSSGPGLDAGGHGKLRGDAAKRNHVSGKAKQPPEEQLLWNSPGVLVEDRSHGGVCRGQGDRAGVGPGLCDRRDVEAGGGPATEENPLFGRRSQGNGSSQRISRRADGVTSASGGAAIDHGRRASG